MSTVNNGIGRCCKGCTDREVGCHATCEKYISQKMEHERLREEIYEKKRIAGLACTQLSCGAYRQYMKNKQRTAGR